MKIGSGSINFDLWRENYDSLTFEDQCRFYDWVAEKYPDQAEYNAEPIRYALYRATEEIGPLYVMEIGGWDGALAAETLDGLDDTRIAAWTNYDIAQMALVRGSWIPDRYRPVLLKDFPWNYSFPNRHNVFVATHFIEHIKAHELLKLFFALKQSIKYIVLQAPIEDSVIHKDWSGYTGSHILEIGWSQVYDMLHWFGFELQAGLCDGIGHGKVMVWRKGF
jgi:hypothetical protein